MEELEEEIQKIKLAIQGRKLNTDMYGEEDFLIEEIQKLEKTLSPLQQSFDRKKKLTNLGF